MYNVLQPIVVKVQSHYSVHVWHQRRLILSHTLATRIYVRSTLGIRRVRSEYADIRYFIRRDQIKFLDMFNIYQRMQAYRIYVTHTLTIRTAYAEYARHTLNTAKGTFPIRYEYATSTFVKACLREAVLKVVRIMRFLEICMRFLKCAYAMHTL